MKISPSASFPHIAPREQTRACEPFTGATSHRSRLSIATLQGAFQARHPEAETLHQLEAPVSRPTPARDPFEVGPGAGRPAIDNGDSSQRRRVGADR